MKLVCVFAKHTHNGRRMVFIESFLPLQTVVFPDQVPFDWHERECEPDN